jgi:hypothetical protein
VHIIDLTYIEAGIVPLMLSEQPFVGPFRDVSQERTEAET